MLIGCRKEKSAFIDRKSTDSTLMMVDENHAVVYNVLTGKDEVVEVLIDLPDGTIKIDEHGDTLYWLGGDVSGQGEYISSEEWERYCKKMKELYKKWNCR